jgi:hypothetical protein
MPEANQYPCTFNGTPQVAWLRSSVISTAAPNPSRTNVSLANSQTYSAIKQILAGSPLEEENCQFISCSHVSDSSFWIKKAT